MRTCCLSDCVQVASWGIYDNRDRTSDTPSYTESCDAHLAEMLGDSESLTPEMLAQPRSFTLVEVNTAADPVAESAGAA